MGGRAGGRADGTQDGTLASDTSQNGKQTATISNRQTDSGKCARIRCMWI